MTTISYQNLPSHGSMQQPNLFDRVRVLFGDLAGQWDRRQRYWATIEELNSLSNHDLEDIGIGRWQIKSVAFQSIYGNGQ